MTEKQIQVEAVEFVKELYPRLKEDDAAIERYRAAIEKLPPIVVARGRVLVDGFHRWQAYRREGLAEIAVVDLGNLTDIEIRRESITRNAAHGQQLSAQDKKRLAGILWRDLAESSNGKRTTEIAEWLSVTRRTVEEWTEDIRREEKEQQKADAWNLWLDCHSEREIGEVLGIGQATAHRWIDSKAKDFANESPPGATVENPWGRIQHFDVWEFPNSGANTTFFGILSPEIMENLLWFFTEPGQIVFDPFVGSGTTIEVAKQMGRRVWASDRKPATPMLPIHKHDITTGWPKEAPSKAHLIFLDPPYWKQAAGQYSDDPADLANMTLEGFLEAWSAVVNHCIKHVDADGYVAFIVSPAEDKKADRVVDLALLMHDVCQSAGLKDKCRIIAPWGTQQATGQQVDWARKNRRLLKKYRDLLVMSK